MSHRGPAFWGHQDVNSWRKRSLKCPWGFSESSHWHDIHSLLQQKQQRRFVSRLLEVATNWRKLLSLEKRADLSPLPITHNMPGFSSPLASPMQHLWSQYRVQTSHTPQGHSPCASAQWLYRQAKVCLVWTRCHEKKGFHSLHSTVVINPQDHWQYWLAWFYH